MRNRSPWLWLPSLCFAEGLSHVTIAVLAIEIYMQLGLSDAAITYYTAWLYLPWVIRPFWERFLLLYQTKRWWIVSTQLLLGAAYSGVAFTLQASWWLQGTFFFFSLIAFGGTSHDIAIDSFFKRTFQHYDSDDVIFIRRIFYRFALMMGKGLLVMIAGVVQVVFRYQIRFSWSLIFYGLTGLFLAFSLYHYYMLPSASHKDNSISQQLPRTIIHSFWSDLIAFFHQRALLSSIAFLLLFRLPEALHMPISQLFLQAPPSRGGLGLAPQEFGLVNGTVGVIGLLLGGIVGHTAIRHFGLRKMLWPMVMATSVPNVLNVWLAYAMPSSLLIIGSCMFVVNMGYGLGLCAYLYFISYFSVGKHHEYHYSICLGLMAFSLMWPTFFAGTLSDMLGYRQFFVLLLVLCLLPIIATALLKIRGNFGKELHQIT